MNTRIDFFPMGSNRKEDGISKDVPIVESLIKASEAFAGNTHKCVYLIDCINQTFLYVSESFASWCGRSVEEIKCMGYQFYRDYIPCEELKWLVEINRGAIDLMTKAPEAEPLKYVLSYNFHIRRNKKLKLVNHHFVPMLLTKEGYIGLALCTFSILAGDASRHAVMKKTGSSSCFEYSFSKHKWIKRERTVLSELERDILILSAQGHTMESIAETLCKSVDTVKACKRKLFTKLNVKNITEALSYAINYQLL